MSEDDCLLDMSQSALLWETHFRRVQRVSVREVDCQSAGTQLYAQAQQGASASGTVHRGGCPAIGRSQHVAARLLAMLLSCVRVVSRQGPT